MNRNTLGRLAESTISCPACGSSEHGDFFVAQGVPVDVGSVLSTESDALLAPLGDITLTYCQSCGLVWNRLFDSSRIAFRPGYDVGLYHSTMYNAFVEGLVDRLIRRFDLHGKNILEIGCGTGYLLRRLCERGGNRGTGIDPTVPRVGIEQVGAGAVEFVRDFYSRRYAERRFDFLCCQSVLEDIARAQEFLSDVRRSLNSPAGKIYFEVFNAGRAFEQHDTWSIHYEQCNYFSVESFRNLFDQCGFHVLDAGPCPGNDQYMFLEAELVNDVPAPIEHSRIATTGLPAALANFTARYSRNVAAWKTKLESFRAQDRKVVLWGSGGKGISFLTSIGADSGIRYVVDINPKRQNRFVPRSAQQIVPPSFLVTLRPDAVIIANSAYLGEIRQQIDTLGLRPELWNACSATLAEWQIPA